MADSKTAPIFLTYTREELQKKYLQSVREHVARGVSEDSAKVIAETFIGRLPVRADDPWICPT
jgi:hypothetical protein